jgi:TolA-binding protein
LVARVGVAESNANSVTYAVDELRDNLRSLENYAEELQDLGDLETDIRSVQSQLEDL